MPPARYVLTALTDAMRVRVEERLTPHPLCSFTEPVQLRSQAAAASPRRSSGPSPQSDLYGRLIARARADDWYCSEITGGHYAMLREPEAVATALRELPA